MASRRRGAVAPKAGVLSFSRRVTVARMEAICARTVSPPESGSLRITRSIAWMPLVPS
jgi:hypothetical protein